MHVTTITHAIVRHEQLTRRELLFWQVKEDLKYLTPKEKNDCNNWVRFSL